MKIRIYPVVVEATDEANNHVFRMETFDEHCASLNMKALITPNNVDDICAAIQRALGLLDLDDPND